MIFSYTKGKSFLLSVIFLLPISVFATETLTKEATYYSDAFQGGGTANGDIFDQSVYSAALCDIPLGQYLYVSKGNTGIVVDLNDRPSCPKNAHIIDLSTQAFSHFSPLSTGRVDGVSVTPIGAAPTDQPKRFLPRESFRHLGVLITENIPNILFSGDTIEVSGNVTSNDQYVLVYAQKEGGAPVNKLLKVAKDKTFKGYITLPDVTGTLVFVVASGNSFDTDKYATLTLISHDSLSYPSIPTQARTKITPKLSYSTSGEPIIRLPKNVYAELEITQGKRVSQTQGTNLLLSNLPLSLGKAHVTIRGFGLSTPSPLDRGVSYPNLFSGSILLERSHDTIGGDLVTVQNRNTFAKFRFKSPTDYKLRSKYYIISPIGEVKEMTFPKTHIGSDGFLLPGTLVSSVFKMESEGTYLLEIVREDGIAFANLPITRGNAWPVVDSLTEKQISEIRTDSQLVIASTVNRINEIRRKLSRNTVSLDETLTNLAQAKVEDMIKRGYQGHRDPDGNYIDGLAEKLKIDIQGSIRENIGYGTVSDLSLQDGLEESGVHLSSILCKDCSKVGIGYGVDGGKVYLVHIFGE